MTIITLGKRNRRTNLQLAQEAMRLSEYDDKRLSDCHEDDMASEEGLVARFSFAEDILEDESSVTVEINSEDGELWADVTTGGELWADKPEFIDGDSWADM